MDEGVSRSPEHRASPDKPPDVTLSFMHDGSAARLARSALRSIVTKPGDCIAGDVLLSTSELVTNVILHTKGGGELRVWDPDPDVPLRIEVEDHDPTMLAAPRVPASSDQPDGRGLALVDRLSDSWGVIGTALGKVVWAEFDRDRRNAASSRGADRGIEGTRRPDWSSRRA